MASDQSQSGSSVESDDSSRDVSQESVPSAPPSADERLKIEAMASNPLASSRGSSLKKKQSKASVLANVDDEEAAESLADIVRAVHYRPPTRLAALGSSIVLVVVFGLWIAGDGKANAKASSGVASAGMAADPIVQGVAPAQSQDQPHTTLDSENPDDKSADALEAAEKLARVKAESEQAPQAKAEALAASAAASLTGAQETPSTPKAAAEVGAISDESEADAELDAEIAEADEPEVIAFDPGDNDVPPLGAEPNRDPKVSKKQQRAAAQGLYKEASAAFLQGKLADSEKSFKAALKTDPSLATAYRGLGLVYERQGNKQKAAASLRRYLKSAPRAKDAAAIRARLDRLGN